MSIRIKCLFIDHDDTAVDSTAAVHYPSHLEALRLLRPGRALPTIEQWLLINFHGLMSYLVGELRLNDKELEQVFRIWRSYTTTHLPPFFPGILETLAEFRRRGGRVAVTSHSEADVIQDHYRRSGGPDSMPDLVFGWTNDEDKRKPSPWPVREALRRFSLEPAEALILDDLKPGVLMSQATGVPIAGAGWSHNIAEIARYMRANTIAYFESVADFRAFLFS